ncbi:hypothetical protein [Cryptosporidium hominis TU502]|uniref:hypothetical protein n=1 Tax=Cryptosporidium hominis (strain TU502) TaxID=353151 RepID=UPI0000452A66|nr:hypothetical protein [Cryptosporidium hominis TU502]
MNDEVEKLRRQAEIRKRKLLERSSDRLKLIYPNYEESENNVSLESITDVRYGESSKSKPISECKSSISETNSRKISTNGTFSDFSQEEIGDQRKKQDSRSGLKLVSYIEYWNQKEFEKFRKVGSCILGIFLFMIHNFVPDSCLYQFFSAKIRINSISGIVSFIVYQFLVSQVYLYSYFSIFLNYSGSNDSENKKWYKSIFGCNNTQKVDYLVIMNNIIQFAIATKNFISEWFLLVTFYSFFSFIHIYFLAN